MTNLIKSSFHITKSIILAIILICLVIFMVNNREQITIHLFPLPFTIETRLFFVMIVCFLSGFGCGLALFSRNIIKNAILDLKNKRATKANKEVDLQS